VNNKPHLDFRDRFNAAKLLQTDIHAWKACSFRRCKETQACVGGPRGTCTRTGGWPACTEEGRERLRENRKPLPWQESKTYKEETLNERTLRRAERDLLELNLLLKKNGT